MRKPSSGFTLIELVVVITVLGILAAIALPRFAALQTEARIAKMHAAMGSIKSAAAMAHALQLAQQKSPNESVLMEGVTVTMSNGYPTGTTIGEIAGVTENGTAIEGYAVIQRRASSFELAVDSKRRECKVTYNLISNAERPDYNAAKLTEENCK